MLQVLKRSLAVLLPLLILVPAAQADVLLSELCDSRNNYLTDRFIEIYNSGPDPVDLTGWQIVAMGNGAEIFTWNLSGTIAPYDALVAGDLNTVIAFPVDFPLDAWSDNCSTWNGKIGDGARLKNGSGTTIDEVIAPDTLFENDTLVRNEGVDTPSATYNASQWTATPVDFPTDGTPGTHHLPPVTGPTIGSVATVPASPVAGQTVDVQAVVTDGAATITGVTLDWGTSSGSLINPIAMTNVGGDTFETVTPIPAQAAGTTVFYAVTATNDAPAQTTTTEASYSLPVAATVAGIQGAGTVSPYVGQEVVTSGVVTAGFGTTFVVQDGTGQRSGLWVTGAAAPAVGTAVDLRGQVQELDGNTTLTSALITGTSAGSVPAAAVVTTLAAADEGWEGVLVQVVGADCTLADAGSALWAVDNAGADLAVDDLGVTPGLVLGTTYTVSGPLHGGATSGGIVPRGAGDIVFVADTAAPAVAEIEAQGPNEVRITFTEDLDSVTAQTAANYALTGGTVATAVKTVGQPVVTLTVSTMVSGGQSVTIDGVEDLYGNATANLVAPFTYYGGNVPPGYYDPADGLVGVPLRSALHLIIDNHTSISYTALWTAFYTTDDKPNGKVWDMYSDVPGGTPPYEYTFGVDQGGTAGTEGTGYNREHSWPSSWYGATSPMYTDLFMVYPTDNEVNNKRGSYPFGEVAAPTWTSLNGSRLGPCSYPGYSGTVFEPIDEYKGDFARAYFYMSTRYYGEDGGWPGSDMTSGADLLPWAENLLLDWHFADPVSLKEVERNDAVYAIQGNRNPFIDRPDFVFKMFRPELSPVPAAAVEGLLLHQNAPNPFNPSTVIRFELERAGSGDLQVFDLRGGLVRTLRSGEFAAGLNEAVWDGRDQAGRPVGSGVYHYRLQVDDLTESRRMMLVK